MSRPPIRTRPELAHSRPATRRSSVVLPQPLGPTSEKSSPAGTARVTPSTAVTSPKRLVTACRSTPARPPSAGEPSACRRLDMPLASTTRGGGDLLEVDPVPELVPQPERDHRADDREDDPGGMEPGVGRPEDQAGDEAADERADDPQHRRGDDAHVRSGDEVAGDQARDEAHDQSPNDVETAHTASFRVGSAALPLLRPRASGLRIGGWRWGVKSAAATRATPRPRDPATPGPGRFAADDGVGSLPRIERDTCDHAQASNRWR